MPLVSIWVRHNPIVNRGTYLRAEDIGVSDGFGIMELLTFFLSDQGRLTLVLLSTRAMVLRSVSLFTIFQNRGLGF